MSEHEVFHASSNLCSLPNDMKNLNNEPIFKDKEIPYLCFIQELY